MDGGADHYATEETFVPLVIHGCVLEIHGTKEQHSKFITKNSSLASSPHEIIKIIIFQNTHILIFSLNVRPTNTIFSNLTCRILIAFPRRLVQQGTPCNVQLNRSL